MELATCEHRLEEVARVHSAVGLACPDNSMQFVDEEKYLAVAVLYLVEDGFEPFLELAAVLCTRHESTHIEGEDLAVLEAVRDITCHNTQGKPFSDSGLSDAGLADEDGVILCLAREYADDVAYLAVAPDYGIKLIAPREPDEFLTVLGEHVVGILGILGGNAGVSANGHQRREEGVARDVKGAEEVSDVPVLAVDEREHHVLDGNKLIFHIISYSLSGGEDAVALGRDADIAASTASCDLGEHIDLLIDLAVKDIGVDVHFLD